MKNLNTWTVYDSPSDYVGKYVVRRFDRERPTMDVFHSPDYKDCVDWIITSAEEFEQGYPVKLNRDPEDDKNIMEAWI